MFTELGYKVSPKYDMDSAEVDFLQNVRGKYRVRVQVPKPLQAIIGCGTFTKDLNTSDREEAKLLALPFIDNFKTQIEQARAQAPRPQYHNNVKPRKRSLVSEWYTPESVFIAMGAAFDLDPASPGAQIVPWIPAMMHYTKEQDGLAMPWQGFVWLNPPYGLRNGMQKWIDKLVDHDNGVILLPGYTYTHWFHDFIPLVGLVLFPLNKIQFKSPHFINTRNCTTSNVMAAIGEKGCEALRNAERAKFGKLFLPCLGNPDIHGSCNSWIM